MAKSGVLTVKVVGDASKFNKTMDGVTGKLSGVGSKIAKVGKVVAVGTAAATTGAFMLGKEVLDTGAKLTAWRQKTSTVFEGSAADIRKWADKNNETFGVTDDQLAGMAASFGDLLKPMGFTAQQAAGMSKDVVGLSGALSEWSGGQRTAAEVSDILAKAMLGEREGLKELGISITEAEVQGRLLEKGQKDLTGQALQQAKALATQELIFEKSTDAQKAYADGGNEALRASNNLKAGLGELREQVADRLLPIVTKITQWLADRLPGAMDAAGRFAADLKARWDEAFPAIKAAFDQIVAVVRDDFMPVISAIAGFVKDNLTPILIVLGTTIALLTAPITTVVAAVVLAYTRFEVFRNVVDAVASFLVGTVWPKIQQFATFINEQFTALVEWVRANWSSIQEAITHVVNAIQLYLTAWINTISALWRAWGDDLLRMAQVMWDYIRETIENVIKIIQGVIVTVLALINGDWGEAWEGIRQIAAGIWDQIHNIISTAINLVKSVIGGVLSTIGEVWSGAWDAIKGALAAVWDSIVEAVRSGTQDVYNFFVNLPGRIISAIGDFASLLVDKGKDLIRGLIRGIREMAPNVASAVANAVPGGGVVKSIVGKIPGLHTGTPNWRGGPTWVGERGPELVNLPRGSQVLSNSDSMKLASSSGGGTTLSDAQFRQLLAELGRVADSAARSAVQMQRAS